MHHPTHMARISGHIGGHNIPLPQSHNPSIGFSAVPNPLHSTQNNQKYLKNFGNVSGAPVVQYNRISNMQTKGNQQMNNFPLRRQHQQIIQKNLHQFQHHTHSTSTQFQQQNPINASLHQNSLGPDNASLSHQFQPQKTDAVRTREISSSLRTTKLEEIENKVSLQKLKTNQFTNSAQTSAMGPKTNLQIKKRQIKPRPQIKDTDNEKFEKSLSDGNLNNIGNPNKMAAISDSTTVDSAIVANTNNLEQQSPHEQLDDINKIHEVLNGNAYEKTDCEDENMEDLNQTSSKSNREKTPMCLINDLARFNKISFQYRLTSENGPAHCKRFTVTLKLGDEEYTAEGFKIKKVQHLAAKEAIEKTKYKHPIPKTNRRSVEQGVVRTNITPTVELNALAMKLGQQTYYIFDPRQMTSSDNITQNESGSQPTYRTSQSHEYLMSPRAVMVNSDHAQVLRSGNFGGTFVSNLPHNSTVKRVQRSNEQRSYLPKFQLRHPTFQPAMQNGLVPTANPLVSSTYFPSSSPCKITLIVGTQKFVGIGRTLQQAKHDAAANALQILKEQLSTQQNEVADESFDENDNKSPISLVFEIGIKRNLPVDFKVLREEGPAHMRTFTTACIVGHIITEGEGTGKKISKKKAAQKMLEELKKLPPLTPIASPLKRVKLKAAPKKCLAPGAKVINSTEAKEEQQRPWSRNKKLNTDTDSSNPITKLIEWHQHNNEKEPVFKLVSEPGKENSRRRQFMIEVSSNNIVARGVGNSKKLAKRDAAQNFLLAIGVDDKQATVTENHDATQLKVSYDANNEDNAPNCETNKLSSTISDTLITSKKTNQCDDANESQILPQSKKVLKKSELNDVEFVTEIETNTNENEHGNNVKTAQCIEKKNEVPNSFFATTTPAKSTGLHMKDQLLYLAKLMGFEVDFSDYPKGNHNEFLTIVMLSTNPPQICHGVGVNANESQEDAAKNALKILSEMGLNNAMKP